MARSETRRKSKTAVPLPDIPDKLYFRIGEAARLLAVQTYVLRFWETEFPHLKPAKGGTGQRLYRRRDLDALLVIRRLLYDEGYTIPGARQWLRDHARQPETALLVSPPSEVKPTAKADNTVAKLRDLQKELRELAVLLARPSPGYQPADPAHRGLHLAGKKRATHEEALPLFAPVDLGGEPDA